MPTFTWGLTPPSPSTCAHLSLTPPLCVDAINGWPLTCRPNALSYCYYIWKCMLSFGCWDPDGTCSVYFYRPIGQAETNGLQKLVRLVIPNKLVIEHLNCKNVCAKMFVCMVYRPPNVVFEKGLTVIVNG